MVFYTLRRNAKNVKINVEIYTYISQKELKNMRRETLQEKSFHDMLPPHFPPLPKYHLAIKTCCELRRTT